MPASTPEDTKTSNHAPAQATALATRWARRLMLLDGLVRAGWYVGAALLLASILHIALRFSLGFTISQTWWIIPAAALVAALAAVIITVFRRPNPAALVPILDAQTQSGGLLMLSGLRGAQSWTPQASTHAPSAPPVQWSWQCPAGVCAAGALVTLIALLAPTPTTAALQPLDVSQHVEDLQASIELLEQTEVLTDTQAQELTDQVEEVQGRADASRPGVTWEALDDMTRQLQSRAEEAAMEMASNADASERLSRSARLLRDRANRLPQESLEASTQALQENAQDLQQLLNNPAIQEALAQLAKTSNQQQADGKPRLGHQGIDPEQLAQALENLAKAAQQAQELELQQLDQLCKGGMCKNPGELSKEERERALAQLEEMLDAMCEGEQCDKAALMLAMSQCMKPGVVRGPGAAQLAWRQEESDTSDANFTAEKVNSSTSETDGSLLLATTFADPGEQDAGSASTGGALTTATSGESSSTAAQVLPRHREAVRRFFNRTKDSAPQDQNAQSEQSQRDNTSNNQSNNQSDNESDE